MGVNSTKVFSSANSIENGDENVCHHHSIPNTTTSSQQQHLSFSSLSEQGVEYEVTVPLSPPKRNFHTEDVRNEGGFFASKQWESDVESFLKTYRVQNEMTCTRGRNHLVLMMGVGFESCAGKYCHMVNLVDVQKKMFFNIGLTDIFPWLKSRM